MDHPSSATVHSRQWSELVLELPDNWDVRDLLHELTEADYFAPADHVNAIQVLLNPESKSLSKDALYAADYWGRHEEADRALVSFAEKFFDIPTIQRRLQWQTVAAESSDFPQLQIWLQRLEPALGVTEVPLTGNDSVDRFIDLCCQSCAPGSVRRFPIHIFRIHCWANRSFSIC